MFKNKIKILKLPPLKNTLIFFSRVCLNPDSPKKVFSVTFVSVLSDTSSQTHTMNRRTRHPKWLTELNEKLNDLQSSFKYQFTHGKMAVCPAGRWWFGCLDTLPETLRSRLGVTSEAGTLEDAYVGYNVIKTVKESASETPGNRVWYFALTSVSADDEEEFPFLISRFTGNLSDVGEVKNWFVGLPLDKLPKQWNTFSEFETFGKAEDIQHDFYPECSGSLISGDRDVEGRLPECFSLKKVGTDEEFQVFECPDPLSGRDSDSDSRIFRWIHVRERNSDSEEDLANRQTWTGQRQFNPDTDSLAEFILNPANWQQQPNSDPRRNSSLEVGNNNSSEDSDSEEDPLTFR